MNQTGSLINRILTAPSTTQLIPAVGMGITIAGYSDRRVATIIKVGPSGKTFIAQEDFARRVDNNGMSDCQTYAYSPNPNGRTVVIIKTKHGWRTEGCGVLIGFRNAYHDYSF